MKDKLVFERSSFLVSFPVVSGSLLLGVLAAFFGHGALAALLLFLFLMGAAARIWAFASAGNLSVSVSSAAQGLFPGETTAVEIEIYNGKFLPVIWMEVFFPLAKKLCLTPDSGLTPEDWELAALDEQGASTSLVGEKKLSLFLSKDIGESFSAFLITHFQI